MSGETARCRTFVSISKVTVADVAAASRLGPKVALPVVRPVRVQATITALAAAKAGNSRAHECRREPSVVTTYRVTAH
jgi:hypothetical protein